TVPMTVLAFTPAGLTLAGGAADGSLWIWGPGAQPVTQLQDVAEVQALAFSPDGKTLAVGLGTHIIGTTLAVNPGHARLWDVASGRMIENFSTAPVLALAYAPNGDLAVGCANGSLLIRLAAGGVPFTIHTATSAVTSLAWHPSGTAVVSAHTDKVV